jgi:predicted dehydrogenase
MDRVSIGIVGAGSMGRKHAELVRGHAGCSLVGIVDVDAGRREVAAAAGVPFYNTPEELLDRERPAGMIIATPNAEHAAAAEACAVRAVHMLVEKPLADTLSEAKRIVAVAERHGARVLVGHHRRHSPLIRKAREVVHGGGLGKLLGVSVLWTLLKPADYFDVAWRRERHVGGPLLINLVHELDSLRFICGEIREVHARATAAARGLDVEDSLAISIQFESGALGTVLASDATPAAWSYEATVGENPLYFRTAENCYHFFGTDASLTFPRMELWRYADASRAGWQHPLERTRLDVVADDPLPRQLEHFRRVVRGEEQPVLDAADATRSLAVALAVQQSAISGQAVDPARLLAGDGG